MNTKPGFTDHQKMVAELLVLKGDLVSLLARHSLAVNTQEVLQRINSILGEDNEQH